MMARERDLAERKLLYFFLSFICHISIFLLLVLGFDFSSPIPVLENTDKHDIISAVILGDTNKSKILPQLPLPQQPKPLPKVEVKNPEKIKPAPEIDKEAIALKAIEDKKKQQELEKNLLADILKQSEKQKKLKEKKQKQLAEKFQKTLQIQAEKSLRQQLLDEEIKLKGTQSRQSQGLIDKYKALIIQAISEHWLVPSQADKKLTSVLLIRVAPGGSVLDVQISKSSGDPALDSSARAAVFKASPLPVPSDPNEFEPFRQFVLKVKPENIITSDNN